MRKNAAGIEKYKIVPIYAGNRVGRTMSARAAAKRDPDCFVELWDAMSRQREHLRTEQLSLFDDAKT